MNILVAAGLSDYKIRTTIAPLVNCEDIEEIHMVRRQPFDGEKVVCYSPPLWMRKISLFAELYRLFAILYICFFKKIDRLVAIHFYLHSIFVAFAGGIFRKPYVISIIEEPQLYRKQKLFSFVVKRALSVGVRGSVSKRFLEEHVGMNPSSVYIIPDFFPELKIEAIHKQEKKYDFLFLGEFEKEKRIDILIDAFAMLANRGVDYRAAIAGDGPLRDKISKHLNAKGLSAHVDMLGYVKEPLSVLRQSKVLIMTSDTEGMPTVLIEAMSCGVPFIVPDVGDIIDYAKHQYNALVFKVLDVEQCSDYCEKIVTDADLYNRLCKNTEQMWVKKNPELSLENVSNVWSRMLGNKRK